ncbi:MAG: hypothetical protein DMG58_18220 [Acidobacteria bacterium]|nr:MAG: hypothetical protein DMG58_18220 [Acidobacteriota bacterium]
MPHGAGCRLLLVARLAWVDHLFRRDTESAVARAVELAPGNAEYHTRLAALHQDAGRDAAAIESELRATVQMNPRMSGAWIELGLRAETAGEASQGEADLVRAAQGMAPTPRSGRLPISISGVMIATTSGRWRGRR